MLKGLYTGFTGMVNEQKRLDVISNNMANATTVGYKREGMVNQSFDRMLAIKIKDTSYNRMPQTIGGVHLGIKVGETYTDWDQGSFRVTDKESDLAIAGNGFFAISFTDKQGNSSIKYTRDGEFTIDQEGYFRTSDGDYLLTQDGARNSDMNQRVRIDPNLPYSIDRAGNIRQNGELVATVGIVDFENYDYIAKYGENMYDIVDGATMIETDAFIEQGCLEASNTSVVDEMVQMITISRAYEAGQKVIQTMDSVLDTSVNNVGRVS